MPVAARRAGRSSRPSLAAPLVAISCLAGCAQQAAGPAPRLPVPATSAATQPPAAPTQPARTIPAIYPTATPAQPGPYIPGPCPSAAPASPGPVWPASLPADLPRPADASIDSSGVGTAGVTAGVDITQFRIPESLITSVGTVLAGLRAAGYTVGRGDGEVAEADVPFAGAALRGTIRLVGVAPCETVWIVATAKGGSGNSYLLPRHGGAGAAASALPFAPVSPQTGATTP